MKTVYAMFTLALLFSGCATVPISKPIATTGDAITQTTAYVTAAQGSVKAAIPHADQIGQGLLQGADANLVSALGVNGDARTGLVAIQKSAEAQASQLKAIQNSWGYKLEGWVNRLFWILVGLISIHLIAGTLAIFWPAAAPVALLIAKIINPLGWGTWAFSHFAATPVMNKVATANVATAATANAI